MAATKIRKNYSSETPWEPLIGYSRAVRVGQTIYVSGCTAIDANGEVSLGLDPYKQTKKSIEIIKNAIESLGGRLSDVVRTRMFVTDISQWKHFARAHNEFFENIRPANTFVQVAKLVDPRMMVEMEAEAVVGAELEEI
jgi:enamine deaminase RidA (YjgF/YER057c/UK114 family)